MAVSSLMGRRLQKASHVCLFVINQLVMFLAWNAIHAYCSGLVTVLSTDAVFVHHPVQGDTGDAEQLGSVRDIVHGLTQATAYRHFLGVRPYLLQLFDLDPGVAFGQA